MANIIKYHHMIDSTKRALIKIIVSSDGTTEANTRIIDVSMLAGALNANGYIMSGNTHTKSQYRTTIHRILGAGKISGAASLRWEGAQNNEIIMLTSGSFDYNLNGSLDSAVISMDAQANGDILLNGTFAANDVLTLIIDLKKDARDFDAGQTADPMAFNKGSRAFT